MTTQTALTFHKVERLCSKRVIENLFNGGNKSMSAFPLRAVYMPAKTDDLSAPVTILISVSKRRFKHAVQRNRVKRQLREAYRKHKHILYDALATQPGVRMAVAFIWLSDRLYPSAEVETCMVRLLSRIAETKTAPSVRNTPDESPQTDGHE